MLINDNGSMDHLPSTSKRNQFMLMGYIIEVSGVYVLLRAEEFEKFVQNNFIGFVSPVYLCTFCRKTFSGEEGVDRHMCNATHHTLSLDHSTQIHQKLSTTLRELRRGVDMTQEELASAMGRKSASYISTIECEHNLPRFDTIAELANAAGYDMQLVFVLRK